MYVCQKSILKEKVTYMFLIYHHLLKCCVNIWNVIQPVTITGKVQFNSIQSTLVYWSVKGTQATTGKLYIHE